MTRYLILGMSHLGALTKALTADQKTFVDVVNLRDAPDIFDRKTKVMRLEGQVWVPPDVVCLAIDGNLHNVFSLLENPEKFSLGDSIAGAVPTDAPDRRFVPRDMLRALFQRRLKQVGVWEKSIHAHFPGAKFLHLCSPPPIVFLPPLADGAMGSDDPRIMFQYLAFDAAPAALRMQIYQVQKAIYADHATALDATFVLPPPQACDADGFLGTDYWTDDPTHGNAAYGRLVIDQILKFGAAR